MQGPFIKTKWSHIPITFFQEDLQLKDYPHNDAMVISYAVKGQHNTRTEQVVFDIVDMEYPYNTIIGRGTLNAFEAILHLPKNLSNFVKGKAPMPQDNEGYILYPAGYPENKIRKIHSRKSHSGPNHAFMYKGETSSSRQPTRAKLA